MNSSTINNSLNGQRKRIGLPSAPVYSPNETLNQMTKEVCQFLDISYLYFATIKIEECLMFFHTFKNSILYFSFCYITKY